MAKKKLPKTWMLPTPRRAKPPILAGLQADLATKAQDLAANVLKPRYVKRPPNKARFNYITDIWIKWIGGTLYFGATYACPGPNAISPGFERRFARLEHVGAGQFALSYMRHNDKWFRLPAVLTGDECLDAVENDWQFQLD